MGQVVDRGGTAGWGLSEVPVWKEPIVNIKKIVIGTAAALGMRAPAGPGPSAVTETTPITVARPPNVLTHCSRVRGDSMMSTTGNYPR